MFKYLTKLKPPEKLRKWTEAYKSGWWNGSILQSNQLRKSSVIEAKLSKLGRDETLSLKNDILKGYLGGLGYGGLSNVLRSKLQHKLNQYKGNWGHSPLIFQLLILRPNMLSEKKHDYSHTFSKSNLCQHSMAILKKKIAYF